jgi:hypothetical protein
METEREVRKEYGDILRIPALYRIQRRAVHAARRALKVREFDNRDYSIRRTYTRSICDESLPIGNAARGFVAIPGRGRWARPELPKCEHSGHQDGAEHKNQSRYVHAPTA